MIEVRILEAYDTMLTSSVWTDLLTHYSANCHITV